MRRAAKTQLALLSKNDRLAQGEMRGILEASFTREESLREAKLRLAALRNLHPLAWTDLPHELTSRELLVRA
jgi:hypothetical protein